MLISAEYSGKQAQPTSSGTLNCSTASLPNHNRPHLAHSYFQAQRRLRRTGERCRINGCFPYTGMTGSPAKIIAGANGVYRSSRNPA